MIQGMTRNRRQKASLALYFALRHLNTVVRLLAGDPQSALLASIIRQLVEIKESLKP